MGTTPPTHACAVRFMNYCAETKFEKGASDRNSPTVQGCASMKYKKTNDESLKTRKDYDRHDCANQPYSYFRWKEREGDKYTSGHFGELPVHRHKYMRSKSDWSILN